VDFRQQGRRWQKLERQEDFICERIKNIDENTVLFQSYDYGIAQTPEVESHGGTTFCAVATLALMNQLETCFTNKQVKMQIVGHTSIY
jgi:prenyltransferase beta subunit